MKKWMISAKRADFKKIAEDFHIDPVTARLIRNRDIIGNEKIEEYLNGSLLHLYNPRLMHGMEKSVSLLIEKIRQRKKIRIIGDYDIDGICATYILLKGLSRCGAIVDYEIPDRIKDGYGINEMLVKRAALDGVDTILTCDNGISALEQIQAGKDLGLTMIVTDHHEVKTSESAGVMKELLPNADVIVNPHQSACTYPFKGLCGAVIAYKLIQCLYEEMRISPEEFEPFTEFAAIATVGDVMELKGENRILVREGLLSINHTTNPGLKALIEVNHLQEREITAYHIGFILGPCINASGRLDTAKKALQLFLTTSHSTARQLAEELLVLNTDRKDLTAAGIEEAIAQIENSSLMNDKVLVVFLPKVHESIAGIIAGRIRERYYKPVFVLTRGDRYVKGSGRSIEAYSMFQEMQKCSELFVAFGGHPMAAGLTIEEKNLELLRRTLNQNTTLTEADLTEKILIDIPMPLDYITESLISELQLLEPFGKGNEKPIFADKNLSLLGAKILGQNRNVLKLSLCTSYGRTVDALYFGDIDRFRSYLEAKYSLEQTNLLFQNRPSRMTLSIIYYPEINEFRGMKTIQVIIKEYQ